MYKYFATAHTLHEIMQFNGVMIDKAAFHADTYSKTDYYSADIFTIRTRGY